MNTTFFVKWYAETTFITFDGQINQLLDKKIFDSWGLTSISQCIKCSNMYVKKNEEESISDNLNTYIFNIILYISILYLKIYLNVITLHWSN